MTDKTFTIIDVETTGGNSKFSRVIEIGAIRVERGEVVATYQTLLNPGVAIPSFITTLTGITDAAVARAPVFEEVKDEVLELFEDAIFVAHNVSFDYSFMKEEFAKVGYGFSLDQLCSVRLSRALYPAERHHNLDEIIKRHDITCENRHRALDDALVVWEFMKQVEQKFPAKEFSKAFRSAQKSQPKTSKKQTKATGTIEELVYEEFPS